MRISEQWIITVAKEDESRSGGALVSSSCRGYASTGQSPSF